MPRPGNSIFFGCFLAWRAANNDKRLAYKEV